MRHALASAPAVEPPASQLAAYVAYLDRAGHGNPAYEQAARSFVRRWPDPQAWAAHPLSARLRANSSTPPVHHVLDGDPTAAAGLRLSGGASTARCCLK